MHTIFFWIKGIQNDNNMKISSVIDLCLLYTEKSMKMDTSTAIWLKAHIIHLSTKIIQTQKLKNEALLDTYTMPFYIID